MLRLVRNIALGAALASVAVAVWRDYSTAVTLRRAIIAYLAAFFVSGGLGLLATIGLQACRVAPTVDADPSGERPPRRRRRASSGSPATVAGRPEAESTRLPAEVGAGQAPSS